MSYVAPADMARKMIDTDEAKVVILTKDRPSRACMAGAILVLGAVFAVTVNTDKPLPGGNFTVTGNMVGGLTVVGAMIHATHHKTPPRLSRDQDAKPAAVAAE